MAVCSAIAYRRLPWKPDRPSREWSPTLEADVASVWRWRSSAVLDTLELHFCYNNFSPIRTRPGTRSLSAVELPSTLHNFPSRRVADPVERNRRFSNVYVCSRLALSNPRPTQSRLWLCAALKYTQLPLPTTPVFLPPTLLQFLD